jgi:hypothetical protein
VDGKIYLEAAGLPAGSYVSARLTRAEEYDMIGELIQPKRMDKPALRKRTEDYGQTLPQTPQKREKMNLPNRLTIFRNVARSAHGYRSSFDAWLPGWNYYVAAIF